MFDIDKLNIYWANDTESKIFYNSKDDSMDRTLLNYEKEIILHPRNGHHLLMPLTDEIFVKDIYNDLLELGIIKPVNSSFFGAMLPSTNVKNTVVFVKGKGGVGPVALAITNASVNQADKLSINQFYNNQDGISVPTKLLFKGMGNEYSLDNYTDNKGTIITEILSQLLTTQVDNVKNPTAVLMNINMQTLGVMLYLVRRKMNPKSIVLFLQQPIIAKYLQYQRNNESLFNKQADKRSHATKQYKAELSKDYLIEKLLKDLGYKDAKLPNVYEIEEGKDQLIIKDEDMLQDALGQKFDQKQLEYLSYFINELQPQSRAFSDFQQTQNSDTKGLKDKQMLDEANEITARAYLSEIIDPNDIGRLNYTGVISPFYMYGRTKYSIFDRFYGLTNSSFGGLLLDLKAQMAAIQKGDNKDKVRQAIENDFMLFLVHNFMTSKDEFDKLMKGGSVAKRVLDLKTKLPGNLVLKAFFPMLNNSVDMSSGTPQRMDNLRLFEKELVELDSNDMRASLEEIQEIDSDLYNDLIKLLMFQSGLNISPFNYRAIVPVGLNKNRNEFNEFQYLYQDLLQNAVKEMNKQIKTVKDAKPLFDQFKLLFAANNVRFLEKYFNKNYPLPLKKVWSRDNQEIILQTEKNQLHPILGDAYHKQYFTSLLSNKVVDNRVQDKNVINEIFEDHQDVVAPQINLPTPVVENTSKNKYELFPGVFANKGQTEALDMIENFLASNEKEFTLIGRGGTGKTTIIKKVLENLGNRSVMGVTVSHKAKKVLGRSIGKDKVKTFASATLNKFDESTGKFKPDLYARQQGKAPMSQRDIIIIDEASMISPKMRDEINSLIQRGAKVIYMGDNAQLPPVGESEDSPVFNNKNQYTLREKMRQAKTSPIIGIGSTIAENIESPNLKTVAIKSEDRKSEFDEVSKSEVVFISEESQALDLMIEDIKKAKNNPDFVKAVTFNNENHNASQSVKNLNSKIRAKLWGDKTSNQLNVGEMLTAYDSYTTVKNPTEDDIIINNSEDFVVKAFSKRTMKSVVTVSSREKGERSFRFEYNVLDVELINDKGELIKGQTVPIITDSSKAQFDADLARLWKEDSQLANGLKSKFANLQYGYAITSHKAQGSTYTNTYVFEDNILGSTNGGDAITKNKSLYVAVSRPTTKLVMISERNGDQVNQPVKESAQTSPKVINIYAGTNENAELSNFAERSFTVGGITYSNVEAAFQHAKLMFSDSIDKQPLEIQNAKWDTISGSTAKNLGRKFKGLDTKEWDNQSSSIMKTLIKASFEQDSKTLLILLATGNAQFTHTQDKTKWGAEFPKLLMEVRNELRPKTNSRQTEDDYLFMPEASIDPNITENLDDFQVVWSSKDLPGSTDEFFPIDFSSNQSASVRNVIDTVKTESFEKELGIRNSDGTRKKMKESDYETALRKVKRLNSKYPSMFLLIKTTGEKGDSRVYYSIALSDYGSKLVSMDHKPDLSIRDKYFENGSKTDVKTILEKISKSDSNLAIVAKQLLKYVSINNVDINLVNNIDEPVFDNQDVSITAGRYYSRASKEKQNSISIAEFVNFTGGRSEAVIIHEILHALTFEELFYKNREAAKDFEKLFEYVKANSPKGMYALTNLDEFMTGIFTDARFIQHLKTLPATKSVKEYKNLFEEILDLFRKLFRLEDSSALTQAMSIASHVLMDVRTEKDYKDSFEGMKESANSQYSPSLKLYEGFVNLNHLYQGDEILPFIGESEYYRYLVPMLLKMNPKVKTMFTHDMKYNAKQLGIKQNMDLDFFTSLNNTIIDGQVGGIAVSEIDANFIRPDESVKTIIHEMIHLTLQKEYEKNGEFKAKIDELYNYSDDRAKSDSYGFISPKEFLAEAMSNPDFMEELNNIQYKDETVWSYLMTLVSDFINNLLNIELKSDSVLAEVVRVSEQVLNNNISEIGKETKVNINTIGEEIINNWSNYFPDFGWMNDAQRRMTAKLAEEGKITLTCSL